jgi:nucleotide-binding universal stress UspA family protein
VTAAIDGVIVTLDCADPASLGAFWAALLGGEVVMSTASTVVVLSRVIDVALVAVERYVPPTWPDDAVPKQLHLDIAVRDVEAAAAEAERLGARRAEAQPGGDDWLVLFDPAGHPFCFTRQIPAEAFTARPPSTSRR